jgi:hypothetical protein
VLAAAWTTAGAAVLVALVGGVSSYVWVRVALADLKARVRYLESMNEQLTAALWTAAGVAVIPKPRGQDD